jgi:hypothetical protein
MYSHAFEHDLFCAKVRFKSSVARSNFPPYVYRFIKRSLIKRFFLPGHEYLLKVTRPVRNHRQIQSSNPFSIFSSTDFLLWVVVSIEYKQRRFPKVNEKKINTFEIRKREYNHQKSWYVILFNIEDFSKSCQSTFNFSFCLGRHPSVTLQDLCSERFRILWKLLQENDQREYNKHSLISITCQYCQYLDQLFGRQNGEDICLCSFTATTFLRVICNRIESLASQCIIIRIQKDFNHIAERLFSPLCITARMVEFFNCLIWTIRKSMLWKICR